MNRIESLGTARIALSVALAMVLGAILVPLPRPPRPVVASRPALKDERRRSAPAQPAVPGGAAAPRLAARDDSRTTGDVPRTSLRDSMPATIQATPLHPIPDERPRETLPPHPRDPVPVDDEPRRAPKIELGPIDDSRARRKPISEVVKTTTPGPAPAPAAEERPMQVNVVLNRDAAQPAAAESETVSRLESRLESLQQKLDELNLQKTARSADDSRQAAKLLERVEHMVSMSEMQRKIDSLQSTLEEAKRAQAQLEQNRQFEHSRQPQLAAPTSGAPFADAANTDAATSDAALERPFGQTPDPVAPTILKAPPRSEPAPAAATDDSLPQIRPGPPFYPRVGDRTTATSTMPAAPLIVPFNRHDRMRLAVQATANATVDAAASDSEPLVQTEKAASRSPVTQTTRRDDASEAASDAPETTEPGVSEPSADEATADLSSDPMARESACYEYQRASRCMARGELLLARAHIRKAIAYDPTLQAPRRLNDQIDEAIRRMHRSGRPITGATAVAAPAPAAAVAPQPAQINPAAPADRPRRVSQPIEDLTLHPSDVHPELKPGEAKVVTPAAATKR